jgi:hypothetical protein
MFFTSLINASSIDMDLFNRKEKNSKTTEVFVCVFLGLKMAFYLLKQQNKFPKVWLKKISVKLPHSYTFKKSFQKLYSKLIS